MNQRDQITMTPEELAGFLAQERILTVATMGPSGRPHLVPLHYVIEDGLLTTWTYAKSQKVRNLQRDPRATLQVEAGERYGELRGTMLEADVELLHDPELVAGIGLAIVARYDGGGIPVARLPEAARERVLKQAPKRVGLRFRPTRVVSWDHRKLEDAR